MLQPLTRFVVLAALASTAFVALPSEAQAENFQAEIIVSNLNFPVSFRELPSGPDDFLVVEKFGDIRLIRDGELREAPVASFDVAPQGEGGLISIELYPDFEETGRFLVSYSPEDPLDQFYVSRLELDGDRARVLDDPFISLDRRPESDIHYGGNMRFGPDGHLYLGAGELNRREWSQDTSKTAGSILRYAADGTVPADNPFGEDNPVWAYGVRNPFDFDFTPDGRLFASENGEDVNDEINEIRAGENYGWPLIEGHCDHFPDREPCEESDDFTMPAHEFRTVLGTTGLLVYEGDVLPSLDNQLLVGDWNTGSIRRFDIGAPTEPLERAGILYATDDEHSITDIEQGSDGSVLVLAPSREVGKIIRITDAPDDIDPDTSNDEGQSSGDDSSTGGCSATRGDSLPTLPVAVLSVLVCFGLAKRNRTAPHRGC